MKVLFFLDRLLGKVESFLLVTSLAALLVLTLYSIAYRNLLAPLVLKMQAKALSVSATSPTENPVEAPSAPGAPSPMGETTGESDRPGEVPKGEGEFAGDLDEEETPEKPAAAGEGGALSAHGDQRFAGDLEDEEEVPAEAPAAGKPSQGDFAGDLDDGDEGSSGRAAATVGPESMGASPGAAVAVPAPQEAVAFSGTPVESLGLRVLKFLNFGWIDTVTRHLLLWIAFFGGAIATRHRRHIKIDALSRLLPEEGRNRLTILLDIAAIGVCLVMARAAWRFLVSESATDAVFYGSLPVWVGIVIIPVGFVLLVWHFALDALLEVLWTVGVRSPELVHWREELQTSQGEVA